MRKSVLTGSIAAALLLGSAAAHAGPWEDGMVAYNRGDYLPAVRLFRPLASRAIPRRRTRSG